MDAKQLRADVQGMTEAQRHARYKLEIERAEKQAGLTNTQGSGHTFAKPGSYQVAGFGAIQTADTARHIHQLSQAKARNVEKWLNPEEIINATQAGRVKAYESAREKGLSADGNAVHLAGVAAVRAAADVKIVAAVRAAADVKIAESEGAK